MSHLRTLNRVDSSSRLKRTVVATPSIRYNCNVVRKVKQVWKPKQVRQVLKPTGKVLTTIGHQWRPTGWIFNLGNQCPLTRFTPPKVVSAKQNKKRTSRTDRPLVFGFRLLKTYDGGSLTAHEFCKKFIGTVRFGNDHFGAIMGYEDYVIGDSVIFRVYYVEGLGHNLFSIRHDEVLSNMFVVQSLQEQIMVMASAFKSLEIRKSKSVSIKLFDTSALIMALVNHTLTAYYERIDIFHQKTVPRTPQQNGVVERRNRNLVEAARTMLIFSKAPMFLWAEAVATSCYTQNRSLIHTSHHKTPYKLVHNKKPDLIFFRVFGALCYPTNDSEDLEKLQLTADTGIFVGYAPSRKGYRIYNKRTRQIMETIHVQFDELTEPMAHVHLVQALANSADTPSSTIVDQDAPSLSILPSSLALQSYSLDQGIAAEPNYMEDHTVAPVDNNPFVNVFAPEPHSEASSSGDISSTESPYVKLDEYGDVLKNKALLVAKGYRQEEGIDFDESFAPFWDTVQYDKKAGSYKCQLDEQLFVLTKDTLREALLITPINNNQPFVAPSSSDALINFVNELGYPKWVRNVSNRRHKFHPRPDSPLHLPNEEPVLGYLKFSAKGTKREEYLASVAKYRRYLASETGSVQDSPASKPTPAKPQEKKHKQAIEASDKLPKAKKSKYGVIGKKRSLKCVAASEAEDVPVMEPQVAAEDTNLQKDLEESMKTAYALPRVPLPPVVIREPESRKYQPLPEVLGKGKAKVTEEQVAHDLLSLQKPKKKSHAYQYIFQRHVFEPTGSSGHDESPYAMLGQSDSEEESEKVVLGADEGGQGEGQAGPDPGNAGADVHFIPSPVVHAGSDREHMDLDVADVSPQPTIEQLDEWFTSTAYPKDISFGDLFFSDKPSNTDKNAETKVESMVNVPIQQALCSISLMTSPIIDLTSRPESPKRIGELEHIMANLIQANKDMEERLDKHGSCLYMLEQLDIPQQVSKAVSKVVTDAVEWAMQAPLQNRFRDLLEADMKEILHQRMWETKSYKSHKDYMQLFKALEKSMNLDHSEELAQDLAEARKKKKKSRESPKMPPGLRPSISLTSADLEMDADMAPDEQVQSSDDEDIGSAHIPKTGDIATFMDWLCNRRGITELKPQDLEVLAFEIIKVFHPDVIHLKYQMEECHKLLTDSVDDPILRHNISKPLPLGGPPEECKYDIAAGDQDEGQAGSNPDEISEGQAGPDPGNAGANVHSIPSPVVHAGSDREHMDLDVADVSPQPTIEQLDEWFTATAYPKDISFGDLFFSDKPSNTDKNAETKVESMVNVPIQQALCSISLMTSPIIDLTSRPESPKRIGELEHIMDNLIQANKDMEERLDKHGSCLYTLEQLDIPQQVSKAVSKVVTDAVEWAMQAPLRNRFRDLLEADMKEILHQRMLETESYKSHKDYMQLFKALEKSMNLDHSEELAQDLAEARKKKKKSRESPKTPPGLRPSISLTSANLEMDADMAPDEQVQSSDDEDIGSAHIPKQDQFWIEEECKYDIASMYGISHCWFQRQRFYIDRHTSEGDRRAVRTHMRILNVVQIEVFSMYGYDYVNKIVLHRADLDEHVIAERDFKYLYPSDFEDMYLLNLQGHLNHLLPKDKKILTTAVNQWTRQLVIRQRV
nr:retrovirus-related Pol polyprotein from transposon TNT 1-94 [Tanacetum cinerariifolium]